MEQSKMTELDAANVLSQDGPNEEAEVKDSAEASATLAEEAVENAEPQANADQGDDETGEQKHKRLGGWQRKILKTEQERDFWREEALRTRDKGQAVAPPIVSNDAEPQPPDIETFSGTTEEFRKAQKEAFAKHTEWAQREERRKVTLETFNSKLGELPEFNEMREVGQKLPNRLTTFMILETAKLRNGVDVLKEALLDPEEREQFLVFDQMGDAAGIAARLQVISHGLRVASKKLQAEPKVPPQTKAPKPITPVTKTSSTDNAPRDSDSTEVWQDKEARRMGFKNWRHMVGGR